MINNEKNKAKSADEEKKIKICKPVFDEFRPRLRAVFQYFSLKCQTLPYSLKMDQSLGISELLNLLRLSHLIEAPTSHISTEKVIFIIERYYTPGTRL